MGDVKRYTKEHEWTREESQGIAIGISEYAQEELGDVVFVDLPQTGAELKQGLSFATVESVKAVSEIYAPIDGKVVKVNQALADKPELLNTSAEQDGWIVIVEPADRTQLEALMTAAQYAEFVKEVSK